MKTLKYFNINPFWGADTRQMSKFSGVQIICPNSPFVKGMEIFKLRWVVLAFLSASIIGCGDGSKEAAAAEVVSSAASDTLYLDDVQRVNAGIVVKDIQRELVNTEVNLLGRVVSSPEGEVSISSAVGGLLKRINVKPGDRVKKGDVLCEIENLQVVDWQEGYLIAESEGEVLKSDLDRQREMYAAKASSLKSYQMAEAAYKGNEARKAGFVQRLMSVGITINQVRAGIQRRVTIKAPSSGSVVSVNVHVGMSVADNAGVMTLALDGSGIWVLTGYEGQTSMVKVGMNVDLSPAEGGATQRVPGKVVALSPIIEADRSWKIYCKPNIAASVSRNTSVPVNPADVKIGQAVQGKLILNAVESMVLPDSAVFLRDSKNFCFVRISSSDPKKTAYVLTPIVVTGRQKNKVILAQSPSGPIVVGGAYSLWMMWDASRNTEE
jgi:cobalt-zinc-cadmium efflux system membrane fusion protein